MLTESIDFSECVVDTENHVIKGVKVLGRVSRNGYSYSDDAIKQSSVIFENCPVTVRGAHNRKDRDYNCQNGQLRTGRHAGLGTEAACSRYDWYLNPKDPITEKIEFDAANFPENIPLSQEIGEWEEDLDESGGRLITALTDDRTKIGVAAVYRGGTNQSLFESHENDKDRLMEIKTKEELRARFPSLCEELEECACQTAATEVDTIKSKLESTIAEREAANAKIKDLEAALQVYKDAEEREVREESIRAAAKEIVSEKYAVSDELMEDLLELYENDRYKRTLTEIAKFHVASKEGDEGEADEPSSKSGASYTSNKTTRRLLRR